MKKFEYTKIGMTKTENTGLWPCVEKWLNMFGEKGWEVVYLNKYTLHLINSIGNMDAVDVVLKREMEEK